MSTSQKNLDILKSIKVYLTSDFSMFDASCITMRATRPIVGQSVVEKDFIFYATVTTENESNTKTIEHNNAMDARIMFFVNDETIELMCVIDTPYFNKYMAMTPQKRTSSVQGLKDKLKDKTYGEILEIWEKVQSFINTVNSY